ncbi:hypothetical protein [Methanobrevibacter sp.]|uniref:hypothetical protein n=1 Tax=Methanobrevibacter sp. TaxID=66852 RepID=UPI00388E277F
MALEIAEVAKIKTKIGAIALRTSTNIISGNPIIENLGTAMPKIAPTIIPIRILRIKLGSVYLFINPNSYSPFNFYQNHLN